MSQVPITENFSLCEIELVQVRRRMQGNIVSCYLSPSNWNCWSASCILWDPRQLANCKGGCASNNTKAWMFLILLNLLFVWFINGWWIVAHCKLKKGKVPCLQSLKNFSFQDTILEKGFVDLIASFVSDPRAGQWPVIPSLTWSLLLSIPHPA